MIIDCTLLGGIVVYIGVQEVYKSPFFATSDSALLLFYSIPALAVVVLDTCFYAPLLVIELYIRSQNINPVDTTFSNKLILYE
jgi:hypothetical protein